MKKVILALLIILLVINLLDINLVTDGLASWIEVGGHRFIIDGFPH